MNVACQRQKMFRNIKVPKLGVIFNPFVFYFHVRKASAKNNTAINPTNKNNAPSIAKPITAIAEAPNLPNENFSVSRFAVYALAAPHPKALKIASAI